MDPGQGPSDWSTPTRGHGAVGVCAAVTVSPQIRILLGPQDEDLLGCRDFVGQLVKTELRSSWLEWP